MAVTKPCYCRLITATWIIYSSSIIMVIASLATQSWLVVTSSFQTVRLGAVPCCPTLHCDGFTAKLDVTRGFLGLMLSGFLTVLLGGLFLCIHLWKNVRTKYLKPNAIISIIFSFGGFMMISAAIYFNVVGVRQAKDLLLSNCVSFVYDVDMGGSYVAYIIGSIGMIVAAIPLALGERKERQPVMIGDIRAVDNIPMTEINGPRSSEGDAHRNENNLNTPPRGLGRIGNRLLGLIRHMDFRGQSHSTHVSNDVSSSPPRAVPSAPECEPFQISLWQTTTLPHDPQVLGHSNVQYVTDQCSADYQSEGPESAYEFIGQPQSDHLETQHHISVSQTTTSENEAQVPGQSSDRVADQCSDDYQSESPESVYEVIGQVQTACLKTDQQEHCYPNKNISSDLSHEAVSSLVNEVAQTHTNSTSDNCECLDPTEYSNPELLGLNYSNLKSSSDTTDPTNAEISRIDASYVNLATEDYANQQVIEVPDVEYVESH